MKIWRGLLPPLRLLRSRLRANRPPSCSRGNPMRRSFRPRHRSPLQPHRKPRTTSPRRTSMHGSTGSCPTRSRRATIPGAWWSSSRTASRSRCAALAIRTSRRKSRSIRSSRCSGRARSPSCSPGPRSCSSSRRASSNLDTDVNTYLDFKIPPRDGKPITLRNLMTHTPGFAETAKYLIEFGEKPPRPLGKILSRWVPERIYLARNDARLFELRRVGRRLYRRARFGRAVRRNMSRGISSRPPG